MVSEYIYTKLLTDPKRLTENNQVLLGAMDAILAKRLGEVNNRLDDLKTDVNSV
jgi:hypothetical protein